MENVSIYSIFLSLADELDVPQAHLHIHAYFQKNKGVCDNEILSCEQILYFKVNWSMMKCL
jgi:hypothetical protein